MKRKLLFASSLALIMASCSQTEYDQLEQTPVEGKGIKFTTSISEGIGTRAELSPSGNVFNHLWYADNDRIGVLYKEDCLVGPAGGGTALEIGGNGGWMGLTNSSASNSFKFKASASGTVGYFVSIDDKNSLVLTGDIVTIPGDIPTFRAYWPAEDPSTDLATDALVDLPNLTDQTQTNIQGQGIVDKAFMISESTSTAAYDAKDNSVSKDRFSLEFKRVNPIVYFKIKAAGPETYVNREYKERYGDLFGKLGALSSVKLTAEGADGTPAASKLTFNGDAAWNMSAEDLSEGFTDAGSGATLTATTTINISGLTKWSNDATVFMVVAPVDRTAFVSEGKSEEMVATYTFENAQLENSITTNKDWTGPNWYGFPSQSGYDLDQLPYIAYGDGSTGYVLQINPSFTGKLSEIFNSSNILKGIKKNDGDDIEKSDITEFVSKVDITDAADFATINELTTLTHITLMENTNIPSEAFASLTSVTYLNLPKVTTVESIDAFNGTFKEVYMGSYDFSNESNTNQEAVRNILLKAENLKKADISAVTSLNAGFPSTGVKFTDFTNLTHITVKPGVLVGGAAFKGCINLEEVQFPEGVVGASINLDEGSNSQFMNCRNTTLGSGLTAITISNKVIPDAAFSGCKYLTTIAGANSRPIQPTAIGAEAFKGCAAITDMDLSVATVIGKGAFEDCTNLVGKNDAISGNNVLYVRALTHVSDDVFKNTGLKYVSFGAATTVGTGFLGGTTACTEIEFLKAFTASEGTIVAEGSFGVITGTTLFCNKAQEDISTNTIKVGGTDFDFNAITRKYD